MASCGQEHRRSTVHAGSGSNEEQYQAVGLLCRETMISLAQAVYDAQDHPSPDGVQTSDTDAKRMLDAFLATELSGHENEDLRRYAKAALSLANALTHKRTAGFRTRPYAQRPRLPSSTLSPLCLDRETPNN